MKKYYYYLTNSILRKILISIILRKIKKILGLQKDIPFNLNQINISKREDILMNYLETGKTQDPLKKYKKLYFDQKKNYFRIHIVLVVALIKNFFTIYVKKKA